MHKPALFWPKICSEIVVRARRWLRRVIAEPQDVPECNVPTNIDDDAAKIQRGCGEIHFSWVFGGWAIQDIWIIPGLFDGTTLRGLRSWSQGLKDRRPMIARRRIIRENFDD
jgi:hypothetical protein